jgi:endoglucanase
MYRVNFVASAAAQRSATVYVGRASSPWDGYSGYLGITLTPQETDYTLTFTMPSNDTFARLVFDLGTSDVNITLAQLAVEEITIPTSIPDTKR